MTAYQVASNPSHYKDAHALMRKEGMLKEVLGFPTILAYEGEELIGFIGTAIKDGMIIAGPLLIRSDMRRPITALRLVEAYENAMRNMGIKTFIFNADDDSVIHEAVRRYVPDMQPYASAMGKHFFIRRL